MMSRNAKLTAMVTAIVVTAIAIDQVVKVYILSHFQLYEDYPVTNWFHICYILNDGMAFGIEWFSKLALTLFRLIAVGLLGWYIHTLIHKQQARTGYIVSIAFIIAGALGNLIDCIVYGKWFQGGDWFFGKVVDMLYFPLIRNSTGEVLFFRPVFNIADSCITCAVIVIMLFYLKDLNTSLDKEKK